MDFGDVLFPCLPSKATCDAIDGEVDIVFALVLLDELSGSILLYGT